MEKLKQIITKNLSVFLLFCIIYTLTGCSLSKAEIDPQKSCSEILKYEELVKYYATIQNISEEQSMGDLYKMGIEKDIPEDRNEPTYRILYTPIKDKERMYDVDFLVETKEVSSNWEIIDIKYAWMKDSKDSDLLFLGTIALWVRKEKGIEYSINGDLCEGSDTALRIKCTKKDKEITIVSALDVESKRNREIYIHGEMYFR